VKRGAIWTASAGGAYVGKPRPVVIIQDDRFGGTASITLCAFTSDPTEAPLFRLRIEPRHTNGLRETSSIMVDKVTTVSRDRLDQRIGHLADADVVRLNRALMLFLGLTA
jgi:mRNA interferase MazF